jgi:hypothetical protein
MVSSLCRPASYRAFKEGFRSGHVQVGISTGFHIIREFSPELKQFFARDPVRGVASFRSPATAVW